MEDKQILALLQALAVGDSLGKTTEFASRRQIRSSFSEIRRLLRPEEALRHGDMEYGAVTDDTEQNLFLIDQYFRDGAVSPDSAAKGIIRWYEESPEPQKYIGPSTDKAIRAMVQGQTPEEAGRSGTSCGGVMRSPAAFLCSRTLEALKRNVYATLLPTHNTFQAMEAAMGYAYALWAMAECRDPWEILEWALKGCAEAETYYPEQAQALCAPRCSSRLLFLKRIWQQFQSGDALLDFLSDVYGTTISSCDVFVGAFALFLWNRENVFESICMASMVGGDTDTIGCLAAVLCCMYAGGQHNIPAQVLAPVCRQLDLEKATMQIQMLRKKSQP